MQGTAKNLVYVPLIAAAILFAQGCDAMTDTSAQDAQQMGFCSNAAGDRVSDDDCGDYDDQGIALAPAHPGYYYMWMPMNSPYNVPPMGQRYPSTIGSRTVPKGTPIAKGIPATGGSPSAIQRGGFGIKSGTTGGSAKGATGGSVGGKSAGS
jgi:hypothetical protein